MTEMPVQDKGKADFRHHNLRRKKGHDYRAPWKYHITIQKNPSCPDFSSLIYDIKNPIDTSLNYSSIGNQIWCGIRRLNNLEPRIVVYQYCIMPDHVHILIDVTQKLDEHLGITIHAFKTGIANMVRAMMKAPGMEIFTEGYNDRIVYPHRELDTIYEYIRQNPYRLAVRRSFPEFFQKTRKIFVNDREMQAYGNLFNLRNPFKYALIVHRKDTEADFNEKMNECLHFAINGGIVVSAFISQREKLIRKEIEAVGGRIILIQDRPFEGREKPSKHDFELCCSGKLLVISPLDYLSYPKTEHPSRQQCLDMNKLAEKIASI